MDTGRIRDDQMWTYPAQPGVSPAVHQRFVSVVERATVREALPDSVFAEAQDDSTDPETDDA